MRTGRARTAGRMGAWVARMVFMAGITVASLSGCSCERPRRAPRMGADVPLIRARLGRDTQSVAVAVKGPWRLVGGEGEIASGKELDWTKVTIRNRDIVFGQVAAITGPVELLGKDGDPVHVSQTVGPKARRRSYRGTLRILPAGPGAMRLVNILPMEAYLAGVLPGEVLRSWRAETYKAQAIAARTYALMARNARSRYDFDVYDSTLSQVYGGAGAETDKSWEAVRATWGVVTTYRAAGGKRALLKTYYHSTCGGETAGAGSVFGGPTSPPLAGGVKCTYCRKSPKYRWPEVVLTKRYITDVLQRSGSAGLARLGPVRRVEVAKRTGSGGRIERIRIVDASGQSVLVRAGYWRVLVGAGKVPSTWFDIADRGDRIALTGGRGYGHGVGLCQWGAEYLASRGKTGEEIVRYYYPGVELVRAY